MNNFWKGVLWIIGIALVGWGVYALLNKPKTNSAVTGKPLTIGAILPLTGDFSALAEEVNKGALIAVEEAKTEFPDIKFIAEDDRFDAKSMVAAAQKLVATDKIDAAFTMTVQEAKPVAPVFNDSKTPLLVAWDSNEFLKTGGNSLYSIGFSTEGAG